MKPECHAVRLVAGFAAREQTCGMDGDANGDADGVTDADPGASGGGHAHPRVEHVFESAFEPVGDAVCWLERVCDDCGAIIEAALPASCWRCGADVTTE